MNKTGKIILGLLTISPFLLIIPMFSSMFRFIIKAEQLENSGVEPGFYEVWNMMGPFMTWIIILSVLSLGIFVYYLVHALKNDKLDSTFKLIWILLFLFVSSLSQVVYFFMEIWPEDKKAEISS